MVAILCQSFNIILKTTITPAVFHCTNIIPIYKGKNKPFLVMDSHRPIGLSSMLKKLFEHCLKLHVLIHLASGDIHFAYKRKYSTLDAVYAIQSLIQELGNELPKYLIKKYDITGAFDNLNHDAVRRFFQQTTLHPNFSFANFNLTFSCSFLNMTYRSDLFTTVLYIGKRFPAGVLDSCTSVGGVNIQQPLLHHSQNHYC